MPASPASTSRGAAVYTKLQCEKCHGSDGRGTGAVATTFEDDWRQPLRATDLTEPWTFRGGSTSSEVFMRFRAGMSGTPMPSFKDAASDAEMWDLANYVVSLARKRSTGRHRSAPGPERPGRPSSTWATCKSTRST